MWVQNDVAHGVPSFYCHDLPWPVLRMLGTARGCLGRSFKDLWLFEALEHIFNWRMSWEWRAVQLQFRSPDEQWAVAFWHRHAYTGCRHDGTVSTSQSQTRSFVKTSTATSCQRWCQNLDSWSIAGWFYCVDDHAGQKTSSLGLWWLWWRCLQFNLQLMRWRWRIWWRMEEVAMTIMLQMKDEGCYGHLWSTVLLWEERIPHNDAEFLLGMSPRSGRSPAMEDHLRDLRAKSWARSRAWIGLESLESSEKFWKYDLM